MTIAFATDPLRDFENREAHAQDIRDRLDAAASGQLPRVRAEIVEGDHSKTTWHLRDEARSDE